MFIWYTMYGDRMEKPKWLKKAFPDKPWRYKYKTDTGLEIEPYNFDVDISWMLPDDVDKAIAWIDRQMKKECL